MAMYLRFDLYKYNIICLDEMEIMKSRVLEVIKP